MATFGKHDGQEFRDQLTSIRLLAAAKPVLLGFDPSCRVSFERGLLPHSTDTRQLPLHLYREFDCAASTSLRPTFGFLNKVLVLL